MAKQEKYRNVKKQMFYGDHLRRLFGKAMDGLTRRAKRSHLAVASLACRAAAVERAPLFFVIVEQV